MQAINARARWCGRLLALCVLLSAGFAVNAADPEFADHKVVIQVSSEDEATHTLALNNAANLQQAYGIDNVAVEMVAYGPGLRLMLANHPQAERVRSLAAQGVIFSACANTIEAFERKSGRAPELNSAVHVVPGGVAHILELQEQGYAYIRP